jgi:hypothetical protein
VSSAVIVPASMQTSPFNYAFKSTLEPNSEARNNTAYGVLKLTLRTGGYDWQFVPAAGSAYIDTGTGSCH